MSIIVIAGPAHRCRKVLIRQCGKCEAEAAVDHLDINPIEVQIFQSRRGICRSGVYTAHSCAFDLLGVSLPQSGFRIKATFQDNASKPERIFYDPWAARVIRLFKKLLEGFHWLVYVG